MRIIEKLKKGLLQGLGFLLTVGIAGIAYAAINIVNTGDTLTATKWNELVGLVNLNDSNISTNSGKLVNITSNGSNVGIGVATPTSKLEINSGDIKLGGYNAIVNIGSAVQTSSVTVADTIWTNFPGATKTFNLLSAKTIKLRAYGSIYPNVGGTGNYTHCGFRFVVDGVGYGNATWGDQVRGCASSTAGVGNWCPWNIEREIALGAGNHTVNIQMTAWGTSYPGCGSDANDYSKARLFIEAW